MPRRGYGRNKQGLRNTDRCKESVEKIETVEETTKEETIETNGKNGIRQIIKTKRTVLTSEKLLFRD